MKYCCANFDPDDLEEVSPLAKDVTLTKELKAKSIRLLVNGGA